VVEDDTALERAPPKAVTKPVDEKALKSLIDPPLNQEKLSGRTFGGLAYKSLL
jgi:hypothetical protein